MAPTGSSEKYMCDECALQSKRDSVYRERVCKICGTTFMGYPRSMFCDQCKEQRKKAQKRIYNQRKPNRPLGSMDICENCGKEYVVKGGLQRYCPDCSDSVVKNNIKERKNKYYQENKEQLNQHKEEMRSNGYVCVICGKIFDKDVNSVTCSSECQKEHERIQQNKADIRAGKRKLPANERYISKVPQSGIVGVTYHNGKWQAVYKGKYLGVYPTIELASEAIEQYKSKMITG